MFFSGAGDPFEHFRERHQHSSGRRGGGESPDDVDTTKLYETLGVRLIRGSVLYIADVRKRIPPNSLVVIVVFLLVGLHSTPDHCVHSIYVSR